MRHRYILLFVAVMLGICFFLFTSFYNQAKQEAIKNINNEQLIYAEQAARGIEDFFNIWTRTLTALSESNTVTDMDKEGKETIELLFKAHQDKLNAITRVDATGRIIYTYPFNRDSIGRNISQQNHIREIMRTHKTVVSDVFPAVQGYNTVALHVPVFRNKIYLGSIAITVNFQALAKRYLENIKIGNTGYAWMTSRDGTELYCPVPGHTGKSVFENSKNFPSVLVMADDMLKGHRGSTTYTYDKIRGHKTEIVKKHAVYMPINIGNTFWSIVVATSEDDIIASLEGFRNKLIMVIGLLLLGGVLFSYYGMKAWFIIGEEKKRHLAEEALRASEERFRAFMDNMPSMVIIKDKELKPLFFNRKFSEMFPADGWLGKLPEEIFPSKIADSMRANDLKALSEGFVTYEEEWRDKDGCLRVLETRKFSIGQKNKAPILGAIITDITDFKLEAEALQESETKLQTIFNKVGAGILIIDSASQTVIEANQTAIEMIGLPKERIIGQIHQAFIYPAELGQFPIKDHGQTIDQSECKLLHADGQKKDILKTEYPITIKGRDCYLESFIDISDRLRTEKLLKESEARLQRAEKMEALGTLAGGVAHDLNNVLGVVVGYAELLVNSVEESSSIRPGLLKIMSGGHRAATIVQDLLTLARRGVTNRQVLNLNRIITDCQQSPEFEDLSSQHPSIKVKTDLEPDLLNISGSSVHLGKTLFNLISNASEAMPDGGILNIKTANQYLDKPIQGYDEVLEGDYVVLSVSDTGEGIPANDLKHIFEPFYTKKVMGRSGTGLGLAVVWGTVKDHYGYINVQSEEGKGSTFTLYFPATREDISIEAVAVSTSEYMGKGESILIVDDVKGQRNLATEILQRLNYNVTSVSSGEEAVTYLKEHQVDLMVLDMIMDPGMDGLDTYRSVLEIHPKQKAIIVSGFSETDRVSAAQKLGAGAYMRKPYIIEKLGLAVRKELDRK
ncbi:MAG: PAS domain S-box protein [Smithellaceae bacterium]